MNCKGTFSIVLFGVEVATYKLLYVNVGCQVRVSDGDVFWSSDFQDLMEEYSLNFRSISRTVNLHLIWFKLQNKPRINKKS
jgi:hypothetical protein